MQKAQASQRGVVPYQQGLPKNSPHQLLYPQPMLRTTPPGEASLHIVRPVLWYGHACPSMFGDRCTGRSACITSSTCMISPVGETVVKINIINVHNVQTFAMNSENRQENAPYASGRQGLLIDSMGKLHRRLIRGLKRCLPGFECQRKRVNTCMRTSSDRNEFVEDG